jgi:hypothetical protein
MTKKLLEEAEALLRNMAANEAAAEALTLEICERYRPTDFPAVTLRSDCGYNRFEIRETLRRVVEYAKENSQFDREASTLVVSRNAGKTKGAAA